MSFIEDFQANFESLPHILQKKYALLRDLDKSLQEVQRQNEQRCQQEIVDIKQKIKSGDITPDASLIKFSDEALDEQKHAIRIADEKVALAVQAYDLGLCCRDTEIGPGYRTMEIHTKNVDAHVQQLDQYLRKFSEELQRERDGVATAGIPAQNLDGSVKPGRGGGDSTKGGRKKTRQAASSVAANPTSIDLDLPVDPNEPTYCFCNQVSYGEMVACDNPDCKIEWFHFGCVGLKEQPKGKWYCPDCAGMRKRRKGK